MKAVKVWAVVTKQGRIRDWMGLCLFPTQAEALRYAEGYRVVRVEIRELPKKVKR